ncbi:hypothetical protein RF11_09523 [Thelohanellus kitauei]|uniref:Uncharacterized protein n=1 Tax=Thelohanellus kitauei TaxID=669202 RepID=A0A0C2MX32_THEKT|nr:hypothetical protein RF11_09523 [Thelohanellus kitauei]
MAQPANEEALRFIEDMTLIFQVDNWNISVEFEGEFNSKYKSTEPFLEDDYNFPTEQMTWDKVKVDTGEISVTGNYKINNENHLVETTDSLDISLMFSYIKHGYFISEIVLTFSNNDARNIETGLQIDLKILPDKLSFENLSTEYFITVSPVSTNISLYIKKVTAVFMPKKELDK